MGREVRRVPKNWEHPRDAAGVLRPLSPGERFAAVLESFERGKYESRPEPRDYMPNWPESERTHYQMYEDTTAGTPISPVMESPEALARWLADNNASAFANMTATYEQWLRVCRGGFAPSMILDGQGLRSGVAAFGSEGGDED